MMASADLPRRLALLWQLAESSGRTLHPDKALDAFFGQLRPIGVQTGIVYVRLLNLNGRLGAYGGHQGLSVPLDQVERSDRERQIVAIDGAVAIPLARAIFPGGVLFLVLAPGQPMPDLELLTEIGAIASMIMAGFTKRDEHSSSVGR
jgi:hypothetical protein